MLRPSLLLVTGALLLATAAHPSAAQQGPGDFRQEFLGDLDTAARKLVALAEAMPEEMYDWRPADGVASPAEVYMHIARYNYLYPETALGVAAPSGVEHEAFEEDVPGKAEVIATLRASMDHIRGVAAAMSAADLDTRTRLYGRDVAQRAVLLQLLTHMHEHLGQSIAYARMNGVVPPWSG